MSRLIVKSLPKTITEDRLRKLFSEKGIVTDCKLKYTKDGVFRCFAFVGFQSEQEATVAMEYFNNTFIDTKKIQVETCRPFGDDSKPRSWSRYAKDSSAYQKLHQSSEESAADERKSSEKPKNLSKIEKMSKLKNSDVVKNAKFEEFLQIHGTKMEETEGNSAKTEENTADAEVPESDSEAVDENLEIGEKIEKILVEFSENQALVVGGLPQNVKQTSLKQFLAPVRPKSMKIIRGSSSTAVISFQKLADLRRIEKRNGEFFGGFKLEIRSVGKSAKNSLPIMKNEKIDEKAEEKKKVDEILETGRIFVRNLSYYCTSESLRKVFEKFGPIAEINFPVDPETEKPKGFALVTFVFPENAAKSYAEMDGTIFEGRMLHILPGRERESDARKDQGDLNLTSFKVKKQTDARKSSSKGHNWNSLFLGSNAVADVLSQKLSVDKKELLDPTAKEALGVRLALGETHIVQETRDFLLEHGVALDSFSQPNAPRSKTVILVKNLPAGTTAEELKERFLKFGELGRVVLPPAGISALVEFLNSESAKSAFAGLAYRRFKTSPLFLEWAPGEIFSSDFRSAKMNKKESLETGSGSGQDSERKAVEIAEPEKTEETKPEPEETKPEHEGTILFVKNLNFSTTDSELRAFFETIGPVFSANVSRKRDPKRPGNTLSMGFGFVQFFRKSDADKALKQLQHSNLDGHSLELKLSSKNSNAEENEATVEI